jgi:predicted alpha/beta hydrolase family esterase
MYTTAIKPNCIIVHGCPSGHESPNEYAGHWMPWLKKELISSGIDTQIALMPKPWAPSYLDFKTAILNYHITDKTILIGHSCGCAFLVRWLGESGVKVKKLILVAPWKVAPDGDEFRGQFYNYAINKEISKNIESIIMFSSDNEEDDGKRSLQIFHDALGGEIITLQNKGHYTLNDMGTEEFPELLNITLK